MKNIKPEFKTVRETLLDNMLDPKVWPHIEEYFVEHYPRYYEDLSAFSDQAEITKTRLKDTVRYLLGIPVGRHSSKYICVCFTIADDESDELIYDTLLFSKEDILKFMPIRPWENVLERHAIYYNYDDNIIRVALSQINFLPQPFRFENKKADLANVMDALIVDNELSYVTLETVLMDCARTLFADGRDWWMPAEFHKNGIPMDYHEDIRENQYKIFSEAIIRRDTLCSYMNIYVEIMTIKNLLGGQH